MIYTTGSAACKDSLLCINNLVGVNYTQLYRLLVKQISVLEEEVQPIVDRLE